MPNYASPFSAYRNNTTAGLPSIETLEANPETAYNVWGQYYGANPQRPGGSQMYDYAKGQYDFFKNDFYSQGALNEGLMFTDYLDQLSQSGRGLGDMWSGLAPKQRGERPGQFAPQVRWMT